MGVTAPARLAEGDPADSAHLCSGSLTWIKRWGGLSGHKSDHITLSCFNPKPRLRAMGPHLAYSRLLPVSAVGPPPQPACPTAHPRPPPPPGACPRTSAPGHWFSGLSPTSATGCQHHQGRNGSCERHSVALSNYVLLRKREGKSEKERPGKVLGDTLFHNSGYCTLGYVEGIIKAVS